MSHNSTSKMILVDRPSALLFGDSITQWGEIYLPATKKENDIIAAGWISLLRNRFSRRFDLVNRGYSGYNSRWAVCIANRVFTADEYVFVTIFFGANDAAYKEQNPKQSVPLNEYKRNIRYLVARAKSKTKHVIIIAPPPVDSKKWPDRSNENVDAFASAAMEVAEDSGCDFINLYEIMNKSRKPFAFLSDGLHLNAEGQSLLARKVIECVDRRHAKGLDKHLPVHMFDSATDHECDVPLDFPLWSEVSNKEPAKSLSSHNVSKLEYRCTGR